MSWGCVCVCVGGNSSNRKITLADIHRSFPLHPIHPPPLPLPILRPVIPGSDSRLACALCAAAGVAFSHTPPKQLSPSSGTVQKSLLTRVRVGVTPVHKHVRVNRCGVPLFTFSADARTASHWPKSTRQIDSAP